MKWLDRALKTLTALGIVMVLATAISCVGTACWRYSFTGFLQW